jgi:hypothetical protein
MLDRDDYYRSLYHMRNNMPRPNAILISILNIESDKSSADDLARNRVL